MEKVKEGEKYLYFYDLKRGHAFFDNVLNSLLLINVLLKTIYGQVESLEGTFIDKKEFRIQTYI